MIYGDFVRYRWAFVFFHFLLVLFMISSWAASSFGIEPSICALAWSQFFFSFVLHLWVYAKRFPTFLIVLPDKLSKSCKNLLLRRFSLNPNLCPSDGLLLITSNLVTPIQDSENDLFPSIIQESSMICLTKFINVRSRFSYVSVKSFFFLENGVSHDAWESLSSLYFHKSHVWQIRSRCCVDSPGGGLRT